MSPLRTSLALTMLLPALASAQVLTAQTAPATTPAAVADTIQQIFGDHKVRGFHAKGIMLEGTFTPSAAAASVSRAPHLQGKPVPVTVRFSAFAGLPQIPDNHPQAAPRGLAIRFELPDGSHTDMVTHSFNGFPVANVDQFHELMKLLAANGADRSKPSALETYLGSHPIAKNFLSAAKPAPVSYGSLPYFGVNAFKFSNAAGKVVYGRYRIVPLAGAAYLSEQQAAKAAPDYLATEIARRVASKPVKFKLLLQIAGQGDQVDDPSVAWPDTRRNVELGILSITKMVADSDALQSRVVFSPNNLPDGIAVEDQMVNFRGAVYAESYQRRN